MDDAPADVDRRNPTLPRLTTAQAVARLGVRRETLYAYVSRGLIASSRSELGGSTFDPLEVEALVQRRGVAAPEGRPLMVLDSPITAVGQDALAFRGVDAVALSRTSSAEAAISLLWDTRPPASGPAPDAFRGVPQTVEAARTAIAALGARGLDRLRVAVVAAAAADSAGADGSGADGSGADRSGDDGSGADRSPAAVHAAGARLIGTMVDALPLRGPDPGGDAPLRARLWSRLAPAPASPAELALLDAALVLSLDHDLAVSTFAARVAASARADPYACVQAALGAFGGPLHGDASTAAAALVADAVAGDAARALAAAVAAHGGVPGFGHTVYRGEDPRARELFRRLSALPAYDAPMRTAARLAAIVSERLGRQPNLDAALAVLAVGAGMDDGAGALLFGVARTAGWIAHIVEEYRAPPLRLRPVGRYTGPAASARA